MLPVLESIARADGSTGWSCMIGAEISAIWQRLDSPILDSIFGTGDEVMTRGAITPKPGITKAPGGVRVNGRWPLGSGSYPTDWIFVGGPVAEEDGSPAIGKDGRPEMMLAVLPASEVATLDTWYSIGLRATESHDVEIKDRFVPAERTAPWLRVHESGPRIGRLPIFLAVGPFHLGVVLGIARGMIDELVSLSATKRPFLNPLIRMAEDPLFQFRIGALETRLSAARTFAIAESEIIWDLAGSGSPIAPIERARFRAAMAHVHAECMTVANEIFTLAGTNILYDTSSLQRRFRDIRAVCQHACANIDITRPYGALLLGETPEMVALL
jgi:alkylation response protein AidB-like acyl-CoA dehydrogenase